MHRIVLSSLVLAALALSGCPRTMDRPSTLAHLQRAIGEEVTGGPVLDDHNQLVRDIVESGVLEGMFQQEVQDAIGRGEECGTRDLCHAHGFVPSDWTYEIGHAPGDPSLPAGPTLVIGFDRTGRVNNTYYSLRR
jgi:hypothetical protein